MTCSCIMVLLTVNFSVIPEKYDIQSDILHKMPLKKTQVTLTNNVETIQQPFVLNTTKYY